MCIRDSWDPVPGVSEYIVRRNGSWLVTLTNTLTYTDPAGTNGDTYLIRHWLGGTQNNIACN